MLGVRCSVTLLKTVSGIPHRVWVNWFCLLGYPIRKQKIYHITNGIQFWKNNAVFKITKKDFYFERDTKDEFLDGVIILFFIGVISSH